MIKERVGSVQEARSKTKLKERVGSLKGEKRNKD